MLDQAIYLIHYHGDTETGVGLHDVQKNEKINFKQSNRDMYDLALDQGLLIREIEYIGTFSPEEMKKLKKQIQKHLDKQGSSDKV